MQKRHIGQPGTNLAPVSRTDEPTFRDPLRSESLNGEPVIRSTGFEDGEIPVGQEKVTPVSPEMQERRIISSQMVAVHATTNNKYGTVRHQPVLPNQAGAKMAEENKFFDPGGKQSFNPLLPRPISLSGRA